MVTEHDTGGVAQRKSRTLFTISLALQVPQRVGSGTGRRGGDVCEFCRGSAFENRRHGAASECRARFELSTSLQ